MRGEGHRVPDDVPVGDRLFQKAAFRFGCPVEIFIDQPGADRPAVPEGSGTSSKVFRRLYRLDNEVAEIAFHHPDRQIGEANVEMGFEDDPDTPHFPLSAVETAYFENIKPFLRFFNRRSGFSSASPEILYFSIPGIGGT